MQRLIIIFICTLFLSNIASTPIGVLEIKIDNIQDHQGTLWIGIYRSEVSFLNKEEALLYSVNKPKEQKTSIFINDLYYGEYAVALFQDLNNNGIMDFNWVGVPTEPYAFSKPLHSKWRAPSFYEVKINLYQSQKVIHTSLTSWWNQ